MIFVADIEGQPPERISNGYAKYTNFQPLTDGGKASLTVCKDTNLGRSVVLKSLRPEIAEDPVELRRLLREARITAQLQHPATVPMYELGQNEEGHWFFSMKKIDGQTLFKIIVGLAQRDPDYERQFTFSNLLQIFLQVGDALRYAHARGVIHRDIKPENILVGMFGEVTLIDWGAAKVWGMPYEADETTPNQRGGTPLYMSPEQILGHKTVDERTDIFSMGIVLYEMLAQREPFRGRTITDTFDNVIDREPMPPSEAAPDRFIPPEIEAICLKAISKEPSDRFNTIAEMINAIKQFMDNALQRASK